MNVVNPKPGSRPDPAQHRVAIYTRAADLSSIDEQRAALLTCVVIDHHPQWQLVAEFGDITPHSGRRHPRPGLQFLLNVAPAGTFDVLLVHRLDRLTRRTRLLRHILGHLDTAGVAVRTLADPAAPSGPPLPAAGPASDHHDTGGEDHR